MSKTNEKIESFINTLKHIYPKWESLDCNQIMIEIIKNNNVSLASLLVNNGFNLNKLPINYVISDDFNYLETTIMLERLKLLEYFVKQDVNMRYLCNDMIYSTLFCFRENPDIKLLRLMRDNGLTLRQNDIDTVIQYLDDLAYIPDAISFVNAIEYNDIKDYVIDKDFKMTINTQIMLAFVESECKITDEASYNMTVIAVKKNDEDLLQALKQRWSPSDSELDVLLELYTKYECNIDIFKILTSKADSDLKTFEEKMNYYVDNDGIKLIKTFESAFSNSIKINDENYYLIGEEHYQYFQKIVLDNYRSNTSKLHNNSSNEYTSDDEIENETDDEYQMSDYVELADNEMTDSEAINID